MGPITLFDKSFLQSLSLDESVWFDHFTLTNVCPIFFVETLADLNKPTTPPKSPDDEVRIIAQKFPDMNSGPCAHHADLALSSLLGYDVPMRGQIPIDSGRLVSLDGQPSVIAGMSPMAEAIDRWQDEDFTELERAFASEWREQLSQVDFQQFPDLLQHCGEFRAQCTTLEEAKALATDFATSTDAPFLRMEICLSILQVPESAHARIRARWASRGYPPLHDFAPYAAFQLSVILFFFICLNSRIISSRRPSNLLDIAYLFYLPFCMVFVSSDKLHREVAPLFLRTNQEFVWGLDLKVSLRELNIFFSVYPESEREKGLHALAPTPPQHIDTLVSQLWDRHLPSWRQRQSKATKVEGATPFPEILDKVKRMERAPTLKPAPGEVRVDDIQSAALRRRVRGKKGAWYQVPRSQQPKGTPPGGGDDAA